MKKYRILVVDDCPATNKLFAEVASLVFFDEIEVLQASTVEDGIALFQKKKPFLTFVDHNLEKQKGLAFLKAINQQAWQHIILISGNCTPDRVDEYLSRGASCFLHKPMRLPTIAANIRKYMELERKRLDHIVEQAARLDRMIALSGEALDELQGIFNGKNRIKEARRMDQNIGTVKTVAELVAQLSGLQGDMPVKIEHDDVGVGLTIVETDDDKFLTFEGLMGVEDEDIVY